MPRRSLVVHTELDEHLNALLPRTRTTVIGAAVTVLALVALACIMLPTSIGRVAISTSIVVATASAYIAGSCYRLRDVRRRRGNELRDRNDPEANRMRAVFPPRETIAKRFRVSSYGITTGLLGLTAAAAIGYATSGSSEVGGWYAVAALLGAVLSALVFVVATLSRPLD